ncbi:MAG: hypothetical protein E7231_13415 [Cellulosilyticum sp.]|nr:hypothetical protein [Cellulosilyticum sp.]
MHKGYEQYKPTNKQMTFPLIILIVTIVIGGILLFMARGIENESKRSIFKIPALKTLMLEKTGDYIIYLGIEGTFEGEPYSMPKDYSSLSIEATFNGESVPLIPVEEPYEYGEEGDKSIDVYTFRAQELGEYTFECEITEDTIEEAILSVGKAPEHIESMLVLIIIGSLLILMGTCQFVGYLIYNGVHYGIYYYKKKSSGI